MAGLPAFDIKKDLFSTLGVDNKRAATRDLSPSQPLKMAIIPVNEPSNPRLTTLILNPESIRETKSANWVRQNIPGQSDPLLQWINGSERTVTFMAKVTLDIAENQTVDQTSEQDIWTLNVEPELGRIQEITSKYDAQILSSLSKTTLLTPFNQTDLTKQDTVKRWKVSIQPQLDFYRSLLLPRHSSQTKQNKTPPIVKLHMGDILGAEKFSKNQDYILAAYDISITQCTPEMLPTQAEVVFTFIEYNDFSKTYQYKAPAVGSALLRNEGINPNPTPINKLKRVIDGGTSGNGVA